MGLLDPPGLTLAAGDGRYAQRSSRQFNVKDFGATGDGTTDDTAAIDAAFAARGSLFFPAGVYVYNGDGFTGDRPNIIGEGKSFTWILLGAGKSLLTRASAYSQLHVQGIRFVGGFGAIRHAFTGNNVTGVHSVYDCEFSGYTGAAISSLSLDMPYWKIHRNVFRAANFTSSIGVALGGNTDLVEICSNAFLANRVSIKLVNGGNNARIRDNDFIRFGLTAGQPRIDVWVVPNSTSANPGVGLTISENKFGNENLSAGDLRVVYADEDTASGADRATRFPALATASEGLIGGHQIEANMLNGASGAPSAFVFSTTPNVLGCSYSGIVFGTSPTYILEYLTPPTTPERNNSRNIIGPFVGPGGAGIDTVAVRATNDPGGVLQIDPTQIMDYTGALAYSGGSDGTGYVKLLNAALASFTASAVSLAAITDSRGGTDASRLTLSSGGTLYSGLTAPTVGVPVWVEFDIKQGNTSPLDQFAVQLRYPSGGAHHWRRIVRLLPRWRRHRFLVHIREAAQLINLELQAVGTDTGTVDIGRVRVYHAYEPQIDGLEKLAPLASPAFTGAPTINGSLVPSGVLFGRPGDRNPITPVVMAGDSITAAGVYFGSQGAAALGAYPTARVGSALLATGDAGVAGDTSAMLLARFDADVIAKNPRLVHILIGTNDAGTAGITLATYAANVRAMVAKCRAIGARIILGTIPPSGSATPTDRKARIVQFNQWLCRFALAQQIQVADYYAVLVNQTTGGFQAAFDSGDAVHPSHAGVAAMCTELVASNNRPLTAALLLTKDHVDPWNYMRNGLFLQAFGTGWNQPVVSGLTLSTVSGDTTIQGNWGKLAAVATASSSQAFQTQTTTQGGNGVTPGNRMMLGVRVQSGATSAPQSWSTSLRTTDGAYDIRANQLHGGYTGNGGMVIMGEGPAAPSMASAQGSITLTAGTGDVQVAQYTVYDLQAMGITDASGVLL